MAMATAANSPALANTCWLHQRSRGRKRFPPRRPSALFLPRCRLTQPWTGAFHPGSQRWKLDCNVTLKEPTKATDFSRPQETLTSPPTTTNIQKNHQTNSHRSEAGDHRVDWLAMLFMNKKKPNKKKLSRARRNRACESQKARVHATKTERLITI